MKDRVLFVDDEPNVLDGIRRQLRIGVELETATSAAAGLDIIKSQGPFAVVVSDMRMPEMDGARFLAKVNEIAPQTVRMVLSGQADLESTIAAVNEGRVFRFLLKPCNSETLFGVDQERHRAVPPDARGKAPARKHAERDGQGAVSMCWALSTRGAAARRADPAIRGNARRCAQAPARMWQYHLAAMISQLGCITLPPETLAQASQRPAALGRRAPACTNRIRKSPANCSAQIPRLEAVAGMVAGQMQVPRTDLASGDLATWDAAEGRRRHPLGGGPFRSTHSSTRAVARAGRAAHRPGSAPHLPPAITQAMVKAIADDSGLVMSREVNRDELAVGMVIDADVL